MIYEISVVRDKQGKGVSTLKELKNRKTLTDNTVFKFPLGQVEKYYFKDKNVASMFLRREQNGIHD